MAAAVRADQKRARLALGQLPLSFEMNRGQFDPQVQFVSRGTGYKAFLTQSETVFVLRKPSASNANEKNALEKVKGATRAERAAELTRLRKEEAAARAASKAVVRMSLIGANPAPRITGMDELPGKINYFRGNNEQKWITDVPTFRRVMYAGIYPGIDLVYYGNGRDLEYDLVVAPGADPNQIGFNFDGAERLEVNAATGGLIIHAAGGAQLRQGKPLIYQEINGSRQAITGSFTATGNRAGFSIGEYDKSRPLVIDPAIINYSTYLGGDDDDRAHAIAADADGNAYVVGWTFSENFPVKDAYQAGQNNDTEQAFITKFNPDGSQLIWSTYLGGADNTCAPRGTSWAKEPMAWRLMPTGMFTSPGSRFPSIFRRVMRCNRINRMAGRAVLGPRLDSFITKLNAAGNQLVFSTYFGGADGDDVGRGIAVDSHNNVYVTGYTDSFAFPTTKPIQPEIDGRTVHFNNGEQPLDAYLAKIDASGQFRVYSTYIGGPNNDVGYGVAVDQDGAAYVTGWTESTQPEDTGAPSGSPTPTPSPTATPTATPIGFAHFPITEDAFQQNPGGSGNTRDAFVTKVDPTGSQYLYSTYLGGAGKDAATGIALGVDRSAFVTGYTNSGATSTLSAQIAVPGPDEFPTTANAFQSLNAGGYDAFLTRLSPDGSDLIYSTYIGGEADEGNSNNDDCLQCNFPRQLDGGAVAADILGNAYITGWTESTTVPAPSGGSPNGAAVLPVNFPTKDAFQPEPGSSPGSSFTTVPRRLCVDVQHERQRE